MDPLTHGLIGATASQTLADKKKMRPAAFTGFIAAMLADLDIFIHDPNNPLLNIELHRQFTHSLIFIPVGALVATGILWWFVRRHITLKETYLFSLVAYATSGITDTFTSYGTKLLWPFVDERYAWNIISVFDPLFSLGIIVLVVFAIWQKKHLFIWLTWGWIAIYLFGGFLQLQRAHTAAENLANSRGHEIQDSVIKPTIGNQIIWSIRYISNDTLYADAVRLSRFSSNRIYEGESTPLLDWRSEYAEFRGTTLYDDIQRFSVLSDDILIRHPEKPNIIGDGRYAMLPISTTPLWGIEVDTTRPNQHVPFLNFRDGSQEVRDTFWDMLRGGDL